MSNVNENSGIVGAFSPMLDFLTATFGPQKSVLYEIDPNTGASRAILSKLPGINPGDELGPIGKQVLANSKKGYHYLIHSDKNEETKEPEKLSYFLIRNQQQEVIGILMVAFEIRHLLTIKNTIDQVLGFAPIENRPLEFNDFYHELENGSFSLSSYAANVIGSIIAEYPIPVQRMTMDEKAQIVNRLDKMEIFKLKGSVKEATNQLMISQATLYRLFKREE